MITGWGAAFLIKIVEIESITNIIKFYKVKYDMYLWSLSQPVPGFSPKFTTQKC